MAGAVRDDELVRAVADIRLVPDRYRVFGEPVDEVADRYRIAPDVLVHALDLGLPSEGTGRARRFDRLDLRNLTISLRLNAPWFVALRWWASALRQCDPARPAEYRIHVVGRCDRCPGCLARVAPEALAAADAVDQAAGADGRVVLTLRLEGAPVAMPAEVVEVLSLTSSMRWHVLPPGMADDLAFARDTGLADCRAAARLLWQEARGRGLAARLAHGLMVTVPFSMTHDWVEFEVGPRWLPADPLLLRSMVRWGYLDERDWPASVSPWGTFWRLADHQMPLVCHNGKPARWTLPTSLVTARRG